MTVLAAEPLVLDLRFDASADESTLREPIRIAGRDVVPTKVFDTYWRFAARRHAAYFKRLEGGPGPYTDDPVIARHRFTNAYRAADRVSQYLIRRVIGTDSRDPVDLVFRTLLFKMFNRISTWEALVERLGEPTWHSFEFGSYDRVLTDLRRAGERVYSAAYVIPPPAMGEVAKHQNHLRLLETMMNTHVPERLAECRSMSAAYELLRSFPSVGPFLAFQFVIDLNYSSVLDFSEMDFVVAGPGARDGIRKCFGAAADGIEADVIRWMAEHQTEQFERLELEFVGLWGRPLQLIDAQNLFCEVDKYARVVHPEVSGISGRARIKQSYRRDFQPMSAWFPPKWGLNGRIGAG